MLDAAPPIVAVRNRGVEFNHAHAERNAVQEARTTLHVPQPEIVGFVEGDYIYGDGVWYATSTAPR